MLFLCFSSRVLKSALFKLKDNLSSVCLFMVIKNRHAELEWLCQGAWNCLWLGPRLSLLDVHLAWMSSQVRKPEDLGLNLKFLMV